MGAYAELGGKKAHLVHLQIGSKVKARSDQACSLLSPAALFLRKKQSPFLCCLFSATGEWNGALRDDTWMRWDPCVSGWIAPSPNRHGRS